MDTWYVLGNLHWFVLVVGLLVLVHELGHFLVARAMGVVVERFAIGMGPALAAVRRGETEYRIGLFPVGGYVKMREGPQAPGTPAEGSLAGRALWQRAAIVLAGPACNFLLALALLVGLELGEHTVGDSRLGVVVPGGPAALAGLQEGDRVLAVGEEAVDDWAGLRAAIAHRAGQSVVLQWQRGAQRHQAQLALGQADGAAAGAAGAAGAGAGPADAGRGYLGVSLVRVAARVAAPDPRSPAALAGVLHGDRVVALDGVPVAAWHEVRQAIEARLQPREPGQPGPEVELQVQAPGGPLRRLRLGAVPARLEPRGLPAGLQSAADPPGGYTGLVALESLVGAVEPGSPAAQVGLRPGDRLVALGQAAGGEAPRPIHVWALDLTREPLSTTVGLPLVWQRGDRVERGLVRPVLRRVRDELREVHEVVFFGATPEADCLDSYQRQRHVGLLAALRGGARQVVEDTAAVGQAVGRLVRGKLSLDAVGGPVMLFVIAEKSAKRGAESFVRTLALLSCNIGLMNLLPVPGLDGGHLLMHAIEGIGGRPPPARVLQLAQLVGVLTLLALMVVVMRNDLVRFLGSG